MRYVLEKNVLCGDALTLKDVNGGPITFAEWSIVTGDKVKRRNRALRGRTEERRALKARLGLRRPGRRGLELIDARGKDGCLWVVGGGELDAKMGELENQGARFEFSLRGSKTTAGRSAWWLKGYPEMAASEWSEPPVVTQGKLDALEPGDAVFHKAFGYGEFVDIDREHRTVEIVIGLDKKGKPKHRKFLFPNVFEQGLLTV